MSFLPNLAGINYVPGPNLNVQIPNPGVTAQTSGFVQAGDAPPSQQVGTSSGGGGGLGSSPLVPKPGTSINAQTGQLHSEGLTREELQAKRAAEAAAITAQLSSSTSAELNDQIKLPPSGGLGSSPLVPKAGTSINPETGKLHSEGLTREELQAKRAAAQAGVSEKPDELSPEEWKQIQEKGKELLDPTPHHQQARRSSSPKAPLSSLPPVSESESQSTPHATALTKDGRRLSDLTGREQAARQLVGNALKPPSNFRQDSGLITPGLELPGGWGATTKPVAFPGTSPNAPTSIYDDVAEGLEKAGKAAYAVIPTPIKDAFSASPASPKSSSAQLGVSPPSGRRSSVTALFDQAKDRATKLVGDAQGTLQNTQRRASASINPELKNKISDFVDNFAHPGFIAAGTGRPGVVGMVPRYSLPSEEPAGALPGEHTSGVGALPGLSNETGVAVLPDEKKPPVTHENQGVLPGESSGLGTYHNSVGDNASSPIAGPSGTSSSVAPSSSSAGPSGISAAIAPSTSANETPRESTAVQPSTSASTTTAVAPSTSTDAVIPFATSTEASSSANPPTTSSSNAASFDRFAPSSSTPRAATSGSYGGLAAALPATFLGLGGDKGATDVPAALGTSSSNANSLTTAPEPTSTVESGSTPATSTLSPVTATRNTDVKSETVPMTSTHSPESATTQTSTIGSESRPSIADKSLESSTGFSALAVPETRHANERTTSSASVTAIRHGFEGSPKKVSHSPLASGGSTVPEHEELDTSSSDTRHGNENATSSASVTAIRHGHEGSVSKISPLAGEGVTVPEHEELNTSPTSAIGQKSTTPGTGPSHTTSLTPGSEHHGIGHPSTRNVEGASRQPESYPTPDYTGSALAVGATSTSHGQLTEEKRKAEALVEAPAQSSDLINKHSSTPIDSESPSTAARKVNTEPPADGPTQIPVSQSDNKGLSSTTTPRESSEKDTATHHPTEKEHTHSHSAATPSTATTNETSTLPQPTSAAEAKEIAGVSPAQSSTPNTPVSKASNGSSPSSPSPASPVQKVSSSVGGSGHARKESTSSDKKRGLFGKIKDKLKH